MTANLRRATLQLIALSMFVPLAHAQDQKPEKGPPGTTFEPQFPAVNNNYPLTPDSLPQPGVPKGTELKLELSDSKIFPGTRHVIRIYVPAEYTPDKVACTFVFFDNIQFDAMTVFDNLIAGHQMPVTVAIGIGPSVVFADGSNTSKRYDRSFEFDNRTDRMARFVLDEVLPAVQAMKTPDGRAIKLSSDPNDRAIAGGSTGGIAAFNVAWQRPDAFRRVFTSVGTFVGMRGGEQIYVQVRKTEPKPIRIFMVDGANDGWGGGREMGDWWMANLTMERALAYAGYDVNHVWGDNAHNASLATQVFPQAVRWLFRDYPVPIVAQPPKSQALTPILLPGEPWKLLTDACPSGAPFGVGRDGSLYVADAQPMSSGACNSRPDTRAFALAADGTIYSAEEGPHHGVVVHAQGAAPRTLAPGLDVTAITLRFDGSLYVATMPASVGAPAVLYRLPPDGAPLKLAETPHQISSIAISPDGNWLFAAQPDSHLSYSFRVKANGTLDDGEPFFDLYAPAASDGSAARALVFDREGRAYVATALGVQIMDHNGRVMALLPLPDNAPADAIAFGGREFTTLYVHSGHSVYTRTLKIGGLFPASPPIPVPDFGGG
jgi:sugar lactone lactonase YvrE/predicted alpha/beta superfamily hydrolase